MTIPTYPARPMNGGPLEKAGPRIGSWAYEPKENGRRALVHVPTKTMFNRLGQPFSLQPVFSKALNELHDQWDLELEWLDCEALDGRRHAHAPGTLIILDWVPKEWCNSVWYYRRSRLRFEYAQHPYAHVELITAHENAEVLWEWLKTKNFQYDAQWQTNKKPRYEGIVAWKTDVDYPIQLDDPNRESPCVVKHRFPFI